MTYSEVLEYLFTQIPMFHREGASAYKPGLELIRNLCSAIGDPQMSYPCIHIAGTNGKGSTSSLLASILQVSGKKVGLFTSPHLHDFRERMKVNNQMPEREWVVDFVQKHMPLFRTYKPTFFEMTTAMAFAYFAEAKVDIAVIEVGMGGRLDATNIITPILSVITNIGLDHTDFLGHTLSEIAAEKAGIIKPHVPVVIGETHSETEPVFQAKAQAGVSPLFFADQTSEAKNWECALKGIYQERNKCTVYAAVQVLNQYAYMHLSEDIVRQGFEQVVRRTGLNGRWQQLAFSPRIICDTGHNAHGIRYVAEQLRLERGNHRLIVVFGMVRDKDVSEVLRLLPVDAEYVFTQASIPRALPADQLARTAATYGLNGEVVCHVPDAVKKARQMAGPEDLIFVGGSTFVVAEIVSDINTGEDEYAI